MTKTCCLCLALLALAATTARADDSLLETFGRSTGLIAPTADPPDFVKSTRPKTEATSIPVFATPEEPPSKVKTPAELKAMGADLERASHGHASSRKLGDAGNRKSKTRALKAAKQN